MSGVCLQKHLLLTHNLQCDPCVWHSCDKCTEIDTTWHQKINYLVAATRIYFNSLSRNFTRHPQYYTFICKTRKNCSCVFTFLCFSEKSFNYFTDFEKYSISILKITHFIRWVKLIREDALILKKVVSRLNRIAFLIKQAMNQWKQLRIKEYLKRGDRLCNEFVVITLLKIIRHVFLFRQPVTHNWHDKVDSNYSKLRACDTYEISKFFRFQVSHSLFQKYWRFGIKNLVRICFNFLPIHFFKIFITRLIAQGSITCPHRLRDSATIIKRTLLNGVICQLSLNIFICYPMQVVWHYYDLVF